MSALQKLLTIRETFLVGAVEKTIADSWIAEWENKPTVGLIREARAELAAKDAQIEALQKRLSEWEDYFGCESPHDTDVQNYTPLGKEQARNNILSHKIETLVWVVKRLEYIEEYPSEELLCPICRAEKPSHFEDCELVAALKEAK